MTRWSLPVACLVALASGCGNPRLDAPWCGDASQPVAEPWSETPTYHGHVAPILEARCASCHVEGGVGPMPLDSYEDAYAHREAVAIATATGTMPPFLAHDCCSDYFNDWSLTPDQIETIGRWVDAGAPEGDADEGPQMTLPPLGGLSRVDLTLTMAEPYDVQPAAGRVDDFRCFLLDWPVDEPVYVTGMNPVPGNREVVHHLIVAALHGEAIEKAEALDARDEGAGFDCEGGLGEIPLQDVTVLGGSLLGSDFPDGLGRRVDPGAKILLNVHYTTEVAEESITDGYRMHRGSADGHLEDQTSIELKLDDDATEFEGLVIANPAWLVEDGMFIEAGDDDAAFWFRYDPVFFTRNETVHLRSVTPHMHYFGTRLRVHVVREDGSSQCLLEIPKWDFGWEQPFWFEDPISLRPGDELYVECVFDNSAANQPNGEPPRDIAWGSDNQDMCAAFLNFTRKDA